MSLAFFKADDVEIAGETASYAATADSGNVNTRHFCPKCGSRVFGENTGRPGVVGIAVGCVDENDWFAPEAVVYAASRPGWDVTSEEIPQLRDHAPVPRNRRRPRAQAASDGFAASSPTDRTVPSASSLRNRPPTPSFLRKQESIGVSGMQTSPTMSHETLWLKPTVPAGW